MEVQVSNPFKTGRYCVAAEPTDQPTAEPSFKPLQNGAVLRRSGNILGILSWNDVSNPFKTGRYCVESSDNLVLCYPDRVSNPFKTGRYCVVTDVIREGDWVFLFQTPSKRGGTA